MKSSALHAVQYATWPEQDGISTPTAILSTASCRRSRSVHVGCRCGHWMNVCKCAPAICAVWPPTSTWKHEPVTYIIVLTSPIREDLIHRSISSLSLNAVDQVCLITVLPAIHTENSVDIKRT